MQHINEALIQQLLTKAETDGVQKIVVGAVIKQGEKFLLLKRASSDFMGDLVELPSGTVDEGEELLTALAREIQEETGLVVTNVQTYLDSFDYQSGSGKRTRQFNFLVEVAPGDVSISPIEHQAYYYIAMSDGEFSTLNISDAVKAVLQSTQ